MSRQAAGRGRGAVGSGAPRAVRTQDVPTARGSVPSPDREPGSPGTPPADLPHDPPGGPAAVAVCLAAKARVAASLLSVVAAMVLAACGSAQRRDTNATRAAPSLSDRVAAGANPSASERCRDLLPLIRQAAGDAGLEPALLVGLVRTESNFRPDARSPVGALGLTQVMPLTGRAKKCGDLRDPVQNLRCGARVLRAFLEWYRGDLYLGLSGYNAGHGMPDRASRERRLPGNAEYVESVLWGRARFLNRGCEF